MSAGPIPGMTCASRLIHSFSVSYIDTYIDFSAMEQDQIFGCLPRRQQRLHMPRPCFQRLPLLLFESVPLIDTDDTGANR